MKKLLLMLLALMMCLPALAEETADPLGAFEVTVPDWVQTVENAGGTSVTFVHENGTTRVVAMAVERVPDPEADHAAELEKLMAQFAPQAGVGEPLTLTAGFHGLRAITPEALEGADGARIDQVTVMVLWQSALHGELLILSGYDMGGDTEAAEAFIEVLLAAATVNDAPVLPLPALPE